MSRSPINTRGPKLLCNKKSQMEQSRCRLPPTRTGRCGTWATTIEHLESNSLVLHRVMMIGAMMGAAYSGIGAAAGRAGTQRRMEPRGLPCGRAVERSHG